MCFYWDEGSSPSCSTTPTASQFLQHNCAEGDANSVPMGTEAGHPLLFLFSLILDLVRPSPASRAASAERSLEMDQGASRPQRARGSSVEPVLVHQLLGHFGDAVPAAPRRSSRFALPSRELLAEADRGGPGRRTRNGSERVLGTVRTGSVAQSGRANRLRRRPEVALGVVRCR